MTITVQPDTRLRSRGLTLARLAWAAFLVLSLVLFIIGLPHYLAKPVEVIPPDWTLVEYQAAVGQIGREPTLLSIFSGWLYTFSSLLYLILGIVIFWRRSDEWEAVLMSAALVSFGLQLTNSEVEQILPLLARFSNWLGICLFFLAFLLFPDGRFVPRWMRWVAVFFVIFNLWRFIPETLPWGFASFIIFPGILFPQIYRYRRISTPAQRQQTKWVVYGLAVGILPILVILLLLLMIPGAQSHTAMGLLLFNIVGGHLWGLFVLELPIWITISILRSRLWDIDLVIRRTLQYSLLSGLLALVYFGSVVVLQRIFTALTGQGQNELVTVLSTLALAALFAPLRRRVQDGIDRRFYRKKYDAAKVIAEFAATCRDETDLDRLTARLVEVV